MSIKRINEFPVASGVNLTSDDIFLMMDDPSGVAATKKVSLSTLSAFLGNGGGAGDRLVKDDQEVVLGSDGNLTLPASGDILDSNGTSILNSKAPLDSPTFTGTVNVSGSITSGSGNFTSLTVNSSGVSLDGHTHTSSNITDFTSSVSGVISNAISTDIVAGTGISINYDNINDDLIISTNGLTPILALGSISGSNAINYATDRSIQSIGLGGTSTTLTKGTGWPTTSVSCDVLLRITVTSATSITWTIITDWFSQPPAGALGIGTHLVLLRAIGTSTIEGHYIGSKTN